MIPYEQLCDALDRYNAKLRGEELPAAPSMDDEIEVEAADDLIVETDEVSGVPQAAFGADYGSGGPDTTEPNELLDEAEAYPVDYDQPGTPGQPVEGMGSDQHSSGEAQAQQPPEAYPQEYQQPAPDSGQVQDPNAEYPPGYDPNQPGHDPNQR